MRVLFDVLGSPGLSGGMRMHATQIIQNWAAAYPEDELIVLGPRWVADDLNPLGVRHIFWANEHVVHRAAGQLFISARVARAYRVDALISLSPIVSPFARRVTTVCFQHDWRHLTRPDEFGRAQKIYRKLWALSANTATVTACISEKTARETLAVAPQARTSVIENGRDHAASWHRIERPQDGLRRIVTFGHHNNKRPELIIAALAEAPLSNTDSIELTVLGARGAYQEQLRDLARRLGVEKSVRFPGFVGQSEYERIVQSADVVVMASTDEGFGLPVVEAEALGIAAVVTSDSGMGDMHPHVAVADADPVSIGTTIMRAFDEPRGAHISRSHGWADAARCLRSAVEAHVDGR